MDVSDTVSEVYVVEADTEEQARDRWEHDKASRVRVDDSPDSDVEIDGPFETEEEAS
jgi:hypothetical protein